MHPTAYAYFAGHPARPNARRVLDIGGQDMNGSIRDLFPDVDYRSLDIADGQGVDIVADARSWRSDDRFDLVVCAEVFEHTAGWRDVLVTAFEALQPYGVLIATCAGPERPPHSGRSDGPIEPDEWYANLHEAELRAGLAAAGFVVVEVRTVLTVTEYGCDLQATALRPAGGEL